MEIVVQLLVMAAFGTVCSIVAHQRGRNPVGWFFVGLFFNCIGLVVLLVIPDVKAQEVQMESLRRQNRMLRERIDKDRMVADQRQEENEGRLRVHDRALGVDTGTTSSAELPAAASEGGLRMAGPTGSSESASKAWYYAVGSDQRGPVPIEELRGLWQANSINQQSLVWSAGMSQWVPVSDVPGLMEALHG